MRKWKENEEINRGDGAWHMYHSDETRFYSQDESKTIRRLQKEKSKLGFVDEEQ